MNAEYKPDYTESMAYVGDEVWLNCSTIIGTDVEWWYKRHSVRDPVYREKITDDFQHQFIARKHNDREYSLIISNVTFNNSGTYECVEDKGQGRSHYCVLNITGISHHVYLVCCAAVFEKFRKFCQKLEKLSS